VLAAFPGAEILEVRHPAALLAGGAEAGEDEPLEDDPFEED
jgi:hypothetical protein